MIAAIPKTVLLSEKYLAEMFALLDDNMSGQIAKSEVKMFLDIEGERTISEDLAEKIISQADIGDDEAHDGLVSWDEFSYGI